MRVGEKIWHSARINKNNAEIAEFADPTEIRTQFNYFTVMPASSRGFMEVMKYGEDVDSTWTAIANDRAFHGKIKVGDLFWLDGENPISDIESEYGNGATATAIVKSVSYINHTISITLTRNKNQAIEDLDLLKKTTYTTTPNSALGLTYDIQSNEIILQNNSANGLTYIVGQSLIYGN